MHRDDTIGINLPVFQRTSMATSFTGSFNTVSLFSKQGQSSLLKTPWTFSSNYPPYYGILLPKSTKIRNIFLIYDLKPRCTFPD